MVSNEHEHVWSSQASLWIWLSLFCAVICSGSFFLQTEAAYLGYGGTAKERSPLYGLSIVCLEFNSKMFDLVAETNLELSS